MEKTFEMNEEMIMKLIAEKAKYARPKLSRREQEHRRDSSMQYVGLNSSYIVKVHRNRVTNNKDMKNCEYLRGMYRYAEEPCKRIR